MSIVANDCFGLALNIGDFVISVNDFDLSGEIVNIYEAENYLWITIFDEDKPGLVKDLDPSSFTTPERLAEH